MEETKGSRRFNPFVHPILTRVLSLAAPHLYTKEELALIEEIHQNYYHQSSFTSNNNTVEERKEETMNSKKRSHFSSDEGSKSHYGKEERRVKPKKSEKKPTKKDEPMPTSPPPELPIHVKKMIKGLNGTDIKFVMCKKLFNTDLKPYNNRLSLPLGEIKCDFLTEKENEILDAKNKDGKPLGLDVTVLDPYFREFTMVFKKWQMGTSCVYNLVKNWKFLLSCNDMQKGNELNIWCFRVDGKLYFTLNNKED